MLCAIKLILQGKTGECGNKSQDVMHVRYSRTVWLLRTTKIFILRNPGVLFKRVQGVYNTCSNIGYRLKRRSACKLRLRFALYIRLHCNPSCHHFRPDFNKYYFGKEFINYITYFFFIKIV